MIFRATGAAPETHSDKPAKPAAAHLGPKELEEMKDPNVPLDVKLQKLLGTKPADKEQAAKNAEILKNFQSAGFIANDHGDTLLLKGLVSGFNINVSKDGVGIANCYLPNSDPKKMQAMFESALAAKATFGSSRLHDSGATHEDMLMMKKIDEMIGLNTDNSEAGELDSKLAKQMDEVWAGMKEKFGYKNDPAPTGPEVAQKAPDPLAAPVITAGFALATPGMG